MGSCQQGTTVPPGSAVPVDSRRHKGMGMLIQPVLRPVLQPVLRSIFDPGIDGGTTTSLTAYVDSISGSDANDGLTPETALASLSAAQTAALAHGNGASIGLARGSHWREELDLTAIGGAVVRCGVCSRDYIRRHGPAADRIGGVA